MQEAARKLAWGVIDALQTSEGQKIIFHGEEAQQLFVNAVLEKFGPLIEDLAMGLRIAVRHYRKHGETERAKKLWEWLCEQNLQGSPLRHDQNTG